MLPTHLLAATGRTACGFPTGDPGFPVIVTDQPSTVTCTLCLHVLAYLMENQVSA